MAAPTIKVRAHSNHVSPVTPPELKHLMLSPMKSSSLNGEMIGTKTRPLSCSFNVNLPPIIVNEDEEKLRETSVDTVNLIIQRSKNAWMIEDEQGFEPGDRLIAVNGTNVEDMDRENINRLIKGVAGNGELILHVGYFF